MTDTVSELPDRFGASRRIAAEVRAELARQGINQTELARRLHVSQAWTSRRLNAGSGVELTFEEVERIADVLAVPVERLLLAWLGQEPSTLVRSYLAVASVPADVVDLDAYRLERAS